MQTINNIGGYQVEYETSTGRVVTISHTDNGTGVKINWGSGSSPSVLGGTFSSFSKARQAVEAYILTREKKDIRAKRVAERKKVQQRKKVT